MRGTERGGREAEDRGRGGGERERWGREGEVERKGVKERQGWREGEVGERESQRERDGQRERGRLGKREMMRGTDDPRGKLKERGMESERDRGGVCVYV